MVLTGPMMERGVSSSTFSIGALDGSAGLGGMRVGPGMMGGRLSVVGGGELDRCFIGSDEM